MARQKVTLSLNPKTYKKFRQLAEIKGLSISSWVSSKMKDELISHEIITEKKVYALLDCLSNEQLEDIYDKYL